MTLLDRVERPRSNGALAFSLAVHTVVFFVFVEVPSLRMPRATESEYKQAIQGKQDRVLWYKFKKLPAVIPPRAESTRKAPLKAELRADQAMVSVRKDAPRREQTILSAAPELAAAALESPNLIAVRLPPKEFVRPPDLVRPPAAVPEMPVAPELSASAPTPDAARLPDRKLPPKAFVEPPRAPTPVAAAPKLLADSPLLHPNVLEAKVGTGVELPQVKLPPKPFAAPPEQRRAAGKPSAIPDAPQLTGSRAPGAGPAAWTVPKLVRPSVTMAAPPELVGTGGPLDLAIVGLKPVDVAQPPAPATSPAAFSGGPNVRTTGADSEAAGKGIALPGLFVKGPVAPPADLRSQVYAAPTAPESLRAAIKRLPPGSVRVEETAEPAQAPPPRSAAPRVSGAPDPRFNNRDVFMMAIQMPNLTSYSGSWLMWYADRDAKQAGLAAIAPPIAHRKVDPKYVATAVEERVEGVVRLYCTIGRNGKVSAIEVVQGADIRLQQSAVEALGKWEFYPAERNGQPLDVDVLVEIPFRLAPRPPIKR
jgi:TonB family protein